MSLVIIQNAILIVVISLCLLLGLGVLLVNSRSKTNLFFSLTSFAISAWVLFGYLTYFERLSHYALFFARANFASVALCFVTVFGFVRNFPKEKEPAIIALIYTISGSVLAIVSLFTPFIVKTIDVSGNTRLWTFGPIEYVYYVFGMIAAAAVLYSIISKFKAGSAIEQAQIKILSIGISLVIGINIVFNIILPMFFSNLNIYWIGDYSLIFFIGFSAYAIVKYQMFNIKLVATEVIVLLLSIGLLVETFISNNFEEGLFKGVIWLLATYGGYALIKSVRAEIRQKEQLQSLAKRLDQANVKLEELDELKDNFMSMAAHELNTPIAAIAGYLSMIVEEKMCGELNEKAMGYLKNVYFSSKRLAALVRDLLNVSRIESNRVHLMNTQVQMEDIINQAISEVKIKADEVGHKLTFEKPASPMPKTWFDAPRIVEILINIIGNAIKYTEPPGVINVSTHTDGDKIVVAVKDNGRGIPKDRQDHIFEKFAQVDVAKDQVKGTGLGMFISKNLIELHKGKIWFKSSTDAKDHGTTFYFSLPILKEKPFDEHEGEGAVLTFNK